MRVKLQLVICHDDDHEETVTDVITLNKNNKASNISGCPWRSPNNFSAPSSGTSSNSKSIPFSTRIQCVRTAARRLSSRRAAANRFAPCLAPLSSPARGWNIATASVARPRPSGRCRRCSASRYPRNFCIWKRSGPLWCPTG